METMIIIIIIAVFWFHSVVRPDWQINAEIGVGTYGNRTAYLAKYERATMTVSLYAVIFFFSPSQVALRFRRRWLIDRYEYGTRPFVILSRELSLLLYSVSIMPPDETVFWDYFVKKQNETTAERTKWVSYDSIIVGTRCKRILNRYNYTIYYNIQSITI